MFNWLIRKATRAVHTAQQEIDQEKKLKEAHEWGRKVAEGFGADLDAFTGPRFEELQTSYIKVFTDRLDLAAVDDKAPALILARIEYNIFQDNVKNLKPQVIEEIQTACRDWMDVWVQMGNEAEMNQLIGRKVDTFLSHLKLVGLEELLGRVDHLKPIDAAWRAANPEKSAEFPPPNSPS